MFIANEMAKYTVYLVGNSIDSESDLNTTYKYTFDFYMDLMECFKREQILQMIDNVSLLTDLYK